MAANLYDYGYVRKYIINNFPFYFVEKYLSPLTFSADMEEVLLDTFKDPVETFVKFFEMNDKYYNIINIYNNKDDNKHYETEYVGKNKYECALTEINVFCFPFSLIKSIYGMGAYNLRINLSTFKYFDADDSSKNLNITIMYLKFDSPLSYFTLYFATIAKLKSIINIYNEEDKTITADKKELFSYSDREELLLFVNGYVPENDKAYQKKNRVLGDPFWCRSVSEYLSHDYFIIDYKGEYKLL